jgi:hypothetical protein
MRTEHLDDRLGILLEGALESADEFFAQAKAAHSVDERTELLRQRFADNDLVIAVWWTEDDEFEWLPVKGADLLLTTAPKRIAGVPCTCERHARQLISLARESGMLPGTIH